MCDNIKKTPYFCILNSKKMVYSLSYELKSVDKDYTPLFSFLEHGIGQGGIHVLRDSWWIASETELDVNIICNQIRNYLGDKDHIFFARLSNVEINGWLPSSSWNWFNEHKN